MSIRGRFLLFAVVVSVPLAVIGLIALLGIWRVSRAQLDESIKQQAELAAIAYDRWIDAQREPLTTLATVAGRTDFAGDSMAEEFHHLLSSRPFWTGISLISASRQVIVSAPANASGLPPALIDRLLDETAQRQSWVMVTDRTDADDLRPIVLIAAPVRNGGCLITRIDGAAISGLFQGIQLQNGAVLAVFDSQGRILYRTQTGVAIDHETNAAPFFASLGTQPLVGLEMESPYDGIRRSYGVARAPATGNVIVLGIPTATLYQPARRRLLLYLMLTVVIFGCTLLAGVSIARGITRPIGELAQTAAAFGANDLSARVMVRSSGDLANLGITFNRMADQISGREEKLKELDRLKSEFVSSVSHELRTPLTTIKTLTCLLQRDGLSDEEEQEHLRIIAAECDREIDLVLKLLDLSRIESGDYQPYPAILRPAEIVLACARRQQSAAKSHGQQLRVDLSKELPLVRADRAGIERALGGLIENAIKYTAHGGSISVGAKQVQNEVAFYVIDSGVGIRQEDIPKIFDRFYRGRLPDAGRLTDSITPAGVGLGLYLVRQIVERAGGRVEVESQVGKGSTFTLYLPISEGPGGPSETTEDLNVEAVTGSR